MSLRQEFFDRRNDDQYTAGGAVALTYTDFPIQVIFDNITFQQRDTDTILENDFLIYIDAADINFRPKQDDKIVLPLEEEHRVIDVRFDPAEAMYICRMQR